MNFITPNDLRRRRLYYSFSNSKFVELAWAGLIRTPRTITPWNYTGHYSSHAEKATLNILTSRVTITRRPKKVVSLAVILVNRTASASHLTVPHASGWIIRVSETSANLS